MTVCGVLTLLDALQHVTPLSRLLPLPLGSLSLLHGFVFRPSTLAWSQPLPPVVHGVAFLSSTRCTSDSAWIYLHCLREIGNLPFPPALVVCLWRFYLFFFLSFISVFGAPDPSHCSPISSTPSQELNLLPHSSPPSLPCSPLFSRRGPHSPSAELWSPPVSQVMKLKRGEVSDEQVPTSGK